MGRLLRLIIGNGGFVTFAVVEIVCFFIIIRYNTTQKAIFTHTAGLVAGNLLEKRRGWLEYLSLKQRADSVIEENRRLHAELANARAVQVPYRDTFFTVQLVKLLATDSLRRKILRPQYEFISAKVVGNNISSANNWIMINRGSNDSVRTDMGVVSRDGIVGIVRHVDPNFSMVMSVLHRQTKISAALKRERALGSLIWEGKDPALMTLKYVPKHFQTVQRGDTVVTSGYSQLFPKDVPVGYVESKELDSENPYFWVIKVRLSQDMSTLNDVYVVNNIFNSEIDSLQRKIKNEQ